LIAQSHVKVRFGGSRKRPHHGYALDLFPGETGEAQAFGHRGLRNFPCMRAAPQLVFFNRRLEFAVVQQRTSRVAQQPPSPRIAV
jgi:hypothetical protein